jgi:hypothetical protein
MELGRIFGGDALRDEWWTRPDGWAGREAGWLRQAGMHRAAPKAARPVGVAVMRSASARGSARAPEGAPARPEAQGRPGVHGVKRLSPRRLAPPVWLV